MVGLLELTFLGNSKIEVDNTVEDMEVEVGNMEEVVKVVVKVVSNEEDQEWVRIEVGSKPM